MASFFEFSKVDAADLSGSARFMGNAQDSIKEAADAFGTAASTIQNANQAETDRLKTANTNYFQARINQAKSIEEVDAIRSELASKEHQDKYGNDYGIDTNALIIALEARPKAIKDEADIVNGLNSLDQDTVVSGGFLAVSKATSVGELNALIADLQKKELTASNSKQLMDAIRLKKDSLETAEHNRQQLAISRAHLDAQEKMNQYNVDLTTHSTSEITKIVAKEGNEVDVDASADMVAQKLSVKYGIPYDDAFIKAKTIMTSQLSGITAMGGKALFDGLGIEQKQEYFANKGILAGTDTQAEAKSEIDQILLAYHGNVAEYAQSPLLDTKTYTDYVKQLKDRGIDTSVMEKIPKEMRTEALLGDVLLQEDTAALKLFVNRTAGNYGDYLTTKHSISQTAKSSITKRSTEQAVLTEKLESITRISARLNQAIAKKSRDGEDISKEQAELARTYEKLALVNRDIADFNASRMNLSKGFSASEEGMKISTTGVVKLTGNRTLLDKEIGLENYMKMYGITFTMLEETKEAPVGIPRVMFENLIKLNEQVKQGKKEQKAKKNKGKSIPVVDPNLPYQ